MKNLALFLAISLLIAAVGCQENAVAPIYAKAPLKAAPVVQRLQINERVGFAYGDGLTGFADLVGEISYELTAVEQASLKKELPIVTKTVYSLTLAGKGEFSFSGDAATTGLPKPNSWTFSGTMNDVVVEGSEIRATFKIEGSPYANALFHMGFIVSSGRLDRDDTVVEVRGMGEDK
jgi:hypothetical protein